MLPIVEALPVAIPFANGSYGLFGSFNIHGYLSRKVQGHQHITRARVAIFVPVHPVGARPYLARGDIVQAEQEQIHQVGAHGKDISLGHAANKLYVPDLNTGEELKLAPVDEQAKAKQKQLMAETYKLSQDILLERNSEKESTGGTDSTVEMNDKELKKNIVIYLRRMADGQLDKAQENTALIAPCGRRAINILDQIALSEIPEPQLADIAGQVLAGLIRTLRSQIS